MKYIIKTISSHLLVHVVEAENLEEAVKISSVSDDNWQTFLGNNVIEASEYTEDRINPYKIKDYFWDGVSYKNEKGCVAYKFPNGEVRSTEEPV